MRDKIKKILNESDFEWVEHSKGDEFIDTITGELNILSSYQINKLLPFIGEMPIEKQLEFVYTIRDITDDVVSDARQDGYDAGHENGYDDGKDGGYDDGYSEGLSNCDCSDERQEGYDDGYANGQNDCK